MGEQLVVPQLREYTPLSDDELQESIFQRICMANEITNNLDNPQGLIAESKHELQASLVKIDRELIELLDVATERGLMGESILKEVA